MKNREQYKRLIKFIASAFLIAVQTLIFYFVWFRFYDLEGDRGPVYFAAVLFQ